MIASSTKALTSHLGQTRGAEPSRTGRQRGGRRARVVLGQPQRRLGDADLAAVAVLVTQAGQGLPGAPRVAQATSACSCSARAAVRR